MNFEHSKKIINDYSYNPSQRIGKGYSCQVYRGVNIKTSIFGIIQDQTVAIKVISKHLIAKSELLDITRSEINALQKLKNHHNILELKHAIQTKNSMYIITQLCNKGTLAENIQRQKKFTEDKAVHILKQIINGYKMIHSRQIIHRDIKPDNIFVNSNNEIKIGDFGFAIDSNKAAKATRENIGSPLFMPYESLLYNEYSYKSDIWAIGVTFFQMLIGKTPWKSKRQQQLVIQLQSFQIDTLIPLYLTKRTSSFLKRTLVRDVDKRMTPEQLFQYTFTQRQSDNISRDKLAKNKSFKLIQFLPSPKNTQTSETIINIKTASFQLAESYLYQNQKKVSTVDTQMKISEKSTKQHSIGDLANINEQQKGTLPRKRTSHPEQMIVKKTVMKKISLNDEEKNPKQFEKTINIQREKKLKRNTSFSNQIQQNIKVEKQIQSAYNIKIQREILFQLQSQINYFRFLFKLFKKMNDNLKTSDENIKNLKEYLLFMIYAKIEQIRKLSHIKMDQLILSEFKQTQEYINLQKVINEYQSRYKNQAQKTMCLPKFKSEKEFVELLANLTTIIYRNIVKQQNIESHKRRWLIIIIQDLIQLSRLYLLQKELSWKQFHEKSGIVRILEKIDSNVQVEKRWQSIQKQIRKIIKI